MEGVKSAQMNRLGRWDFVEAPMFMDTVARDLDRYTLAQQRTALWLHASCFALCIADFPRNIGTFSYIRGRCQHYRVVVHVVVVFFQYLTDGCRTKPTRARWSERSIETDEHNSGNRILPCHYCCVEWKRLKITAEKPERIVYSWLMYDSAWTTRGLKFLSPLQITPCFMDWVGRAEKGWFLFPGKKWVPGEQIHMLV